MSQYNNSGTRTYTAGEAISLYRRVHLSGDEVFVAGATDFDIGTVNRPSFDAGDDVPVVSSNQAGTVMMVADAAVSSGQKLYAAVDGMVGLDSANAFLGICIIGCQGAEEYIEVQRLSATGSVVLTPEATTFEALNAVPAGGVGSDGDQILVTDDYLSGMILGKAAGAWAVEGQWQVPKLDAEITNGDVTHTAIVAALATQAIGGSYAYQVYRGGRFEQDVIFPSGVIFRNTLSSSGGTTVVSGSGVTLPSDAAGVLQNDGSGNLSWSVVSTQQQFTHTQGASALIWNVAHNLGTAVDSVNIYVGGQKVGAQIDIVDSNNLTITFAIAQSGIAIVEV